MALPRRRIVGRPVERSVEEGLTIAGALPVNEDVEMTGDQLDGRLGTLRRFLLAVVADDLTAAERELAEEATYSVTGRSQHSGVFEGRRAVTEHLRSFRGSLSAAIDPLKWTDWLVGVNHVGVLVRWHLQRAGRDLDGTVLFLATFDADGAIRAVDVFLQDYPAFEDFVGRS